MSMNTCVLMAEIVKAPELRYTPDNLAIAEMLVRFPALREDDPPCTLKAVSFGERATDIQQQYRMGDQVILEGRLSMNTFERPEGFKEKRAELRISKIHSVGSGGMAAMPPAPEAAIAPDPTADFAPLPDTASAAPPASSGASPSPLPDDQPDFDDIPF
ncbi:MAG: single-stranded DNA-binding protein [Cyanobacteria bacterium P01_D01_bin.73]